MEMRVDLLRYIKQLYGRVVHRSVITARDQLGYAVDRETLKSWNAAKVRSLWTAENQGWG